MNIIASGSAENVALLFDSNAIEPLIKLLSSPSYDVRKETVWIAGNIAGTGSIFQHRLLKAGIWQPLIERIDAKEPIDLQCKLSWAVCNFLRGTEPLPKLEYVSTLL